MSQEVAFSRWLKLRRAALDLTQWDLAERVGCSREAIQKIETGTRRPSKQIAELLIACLEIPLEERPAFVRWARLGLGAAPPGLSLASAPPPSPAVASIAPVEFAPPSNLPAPLTALIGRGEEVEAVRRYMLRDEVRLLTVVGPPGIGKTRLSIAVAARLSANFRDGVYFVPLDTVNDTQLVIAAIGKSLSLKPRGKQPVAEVVAQHLRDKQLLLILDNFEQVLDAGPEVLQLLGACPSLKALVTSREPLHAYGECRFQVPPLELPDCKRLPDLDVLAGLASVVLFTQRAQARRPDWTLTLDNAGTIAAICLHLDGLPLAIELAAAQMEDLASEQILAGLGDRLKLLRADLRYLPPRQQTLRGAIDWSYHLLTAGERMLFRRLGVFVGGFSLAAVQAVCNADHDLPFEPQEGIAALSSKSLLYREAGVDGEPRWGMLESIREYARERLEASGEGTEIRRLHVEYCVTLAETAAPELDGVQGAAWLARLERENDNLRAALQWALDHKEAEQALRLAGGLWQFWLTRGYESEGRHWLQQVLDFRSHILDPATADSSQLPNLKSLVAKALNAAGALARMQSDFAQSLNLHGESLALVREQSDRVGIARTLNHLGKVTFHQGDYARALTFFQESLALHQALENPAGTAQVLSDLGNVAFAQGNFERARQMYEESLALNQGLANTTGVATALINLGAVALEQCEYERATTLLEEVLAMERGIKDKRGIALCLINLGDVARYQADYSRARASFVESLQLLRELGDREGMTAVLEGLAGVAAAQGLPVQAARLCGAAEALREALHVPLMPAHRTHHDAILAGARTELGDEQFMAAHAEGKAMNFEQTIEAALSSSDA